MDSVFAIKSAYVEKDSLLELVRFRLYIFACTSGHSGWRIISPGIKVHGGSVPSNRAFGLLVYPNSHSALGGVITKF